MANANMFDQFDKDPTPAPAPVVLTPEVPVRDTTNDVDMSAPDWLPNEEYVPPQVTQKAPKASQQAPAGNMFDQFDAQPAAAASSNMFDQFDAAPEPQPSPTPHVSFDPLKAGGDLINALIPDSARAAAQQAFASQKNPYNDPMRRIPRDVNAMISGAAGLVDAGANFLGQMDPLQQTTGFKTPDIIKSHLPKPAPWNLQGHWDNLPQVRKERELAPDQFDLIKGMTPAFAPLPGNLPILRGPGITKSLVNTAVAQGGINALTKRGEQLKDPIVRPPGVGHPELDVAAAGLEGAAMGAGLHGLGIFAANQSKIIKEIAKPVIKTFSKQEPKIQTQIMQASAGNLSKEQFDLAVPYETLSPENKEWYKAHFGEPEIHGPTKSPMQYHADEVQGELVEPDYPEPKPIKWDSPRELDPYETAWLDHGKALSHESNMAQMKEQLKYLNEKVEGIAEKHGQSQDATTGNTTGSEETAPRVPSPPKSGSVPQALGKETKNTTGKVKSTSAADVAQTITIGGVKIAAKEYEAVQKAFEPQIQKWKRELATLIKDGAGMPGHDDRRFYLNNAIADGTTEYTKALKDLIERSKPAPPRKISFNGEPLALELDDSVEGYINAVKNANTFEESQAAVQAWADKLAGKPIDLGEKVTYGESRKVLATENYGRNKNLLGDPIDNHPIYGEKNVRDHLESLAAGKAQLDYDHALEKDFADRAFKKWGNDAPELTFENGAKIVNTKVTEPNAKGQAELDTLRDSLEGTMQPSSTQVTEAMLSKRFGTASGDVPIKHIPLPESKEEAGNIYANLVENRKASEAEYTAKKTSEMHTTFRAAEKKMKESDPLAQIHALVKTPHPLGEGYAPVEVGIQYKAGSMRKKLVDAAQEQYNKSRLAILGDATKSVVKSTLKGDLSGYRKTKALATAALFGAFNAAKADAANIGTKVAESLSFVDGWNSVPLNEAALGLFVLHKLAPSIAKRVMTAEGGLLAKAAHIWRDTMDYIGHSDKLLNRVNKFLGRSGNKPFETRVMEISGQVQQASIGVHFDEALKAEGIRALRSGKVSAVDALKQKPGTVFAKMSAEEAKALSMWKVGRDELLKLANERQAFLKQYAWANENQITPGETPDSFLLRYLKEMGLEGKTPEILEKQLAAEGVLKYVQANPEKDMFMPHMAQEAVNFVKENLEGTRAGETGIERLAAQAMSNWMDGLFFWNPEFHGTNLMDMFISAAPLVGHTNIWAANRMLAADMKINGVGIRKILADSNLAGGLKVDRAELASIANAGKEKVFTGNEISDIKSDLYNANAVWLGSALKYHSIRQEELAAIGYTGSGEQFVKDILSGSSALPPEIYMDLYAHNANILSRTLGFDTYRLNTNALLGHWKGAKFLFLFSKQPARVSRLAMEYLKAGNMPALYTMLGYTALVGGRAAIPADLRFMYSAFGSADGADKAQRDLDYANIYQLATGDTLSPKVEMSMLWPLQGSSNALNMKEAAAKTLGIAQKQMESGEADPMALLKSPMGAMLPAVAPRVGIPGTRFQLPIPTGQAIRELKLGAQSVAGEKALYAQKMGIFSPTDTETQDISDPLDRIGNLVSGNIPGVSSQQDQHQALVENQNSMEHNFNGLSDWMFGKPNRPSAYQADYLEDKSIIKQLFKQLTGSK